LPEKGQGKENNQKAKTNQTSETQTSYSKQVMPKL